MLSRNKIKGEKSTTTHNFNAGLNGSTLTISSGELWINNKLMLSDEAETVIELQANTYHMIYLVETGIEMCIADVKANIDKPLKPLMLLSYGTTEELFVNEVTK